MNFLRGLAGADADADTTAGSGDGAAAAGETGGGGWLAALKEKSKELAEVYKRDIGAWCVRVVFARGLLEANAPRLRCRRAGLRGRRRATSLVGRCAVRSSSRRLHPAAGAAKAARAGHAASRMQPAVGVPRGPGAAYLPVSLGSIFADTQPLSLRPCPVALLVLAHSFFPAEFSTVVKKDTAVVAGDVLAKTRATMEQNISKASEVAVLAARFVLRRSLFVPCLFKPGHGRVASSVAAAWLACIIPTSPCAMSHDVRLKIARLGLQRV